MNTNNYINNENDGNNGNKGNRGKFSDRLKKMRRDRLKRRKHIVEDEQEENVIVCSGRNVLKVILALPSVVYTNIKSSKKEIKAGKVLDSNIDGTKDENISYQYDESNLSDNRETARRIKVNKIREINVSLLKKKRELYLKENKRYEESRKKLDKLNEKELQIVKLQKEIIDLIKKKLVENVNELEMLHSDLYLLNELDAGDTYLKECQENIKEIKKLLSKVKSLKEKYDYLKDNVDFEYMLEYGDDLLIDKILELKGLCSSDDIRYIVDNYKILDEYKYLYLKIDKLHEDTIKYEDYKNSKAEELRQRDIDFDKLKSSVYDVDRESTRYDNFVSEQEQFLKELDGKISKIDSHEQVSYRLKGFNQLLGSSFKYLGLLLINPLRGLIPGIATQTIITRNMVRNMRRTLEWETERRMVYEAVDYSREIDRAMGDLDLTASMIDSTLEDLANMKAKYEKDFKKYEFSFAGYRDAIRKINKMENAVLGSKIKIAHIQQRLKEKEMQNKNKLKMVKKLNNSDNNN